jgi:hypothetical protein
MRKLFVLAIGLCVIGGCGSLQKKTPPTSNATVSIVSPLAPVSVVAPLPATFEVQAVSSDGSPLNYSWTITPAGSKTGTAVGSNSPVYEVDPTAVAESGSTVSVSITAGQDPVSSSAMLTVQPPSSGANSAPPTIVQKVFSECPLDSTGQFCTSQPTTSITTSTGDSLYVFIILDYNGPTNGANGITPHPTDSNGVLISAPGELPIGSTNQNICMPGVIGGNVGIAGTCLLMDSEISAPAGLHAITLTDPPTYFGPVGILVIEVAGGSHGIDAEMFTVGQGCTSNCSPGGGPVTAGPLVTNLNNELIIAVVYANSSNVLAGAGFTQIWNGWAGASVQEYEVEVEPAGTAGSYDLTFYTTNLGGTIDGISIY